MPRSPHRARWLQNPIRTRPRSTRRSASRCRSGTRAAGWCGSARCSTTILSAHDYPPPIARILAEALVLTALLGATLKDAGGQLTLQAQTEAGVVDLLVADYRGGELRGYVRFDPERLAEQPSQPSLFALFGKGYLAITFDQAMSKRALSGHRAAGGRQPRRGGRAFLRPVRADPEPGPSRGRATAAMSPAASCSSICPRARRGASGCTRGSTIRNGSMCWRSGGTIRAEELADPALPLETLLWRLFHEEEVRLLATVPLSKGCRCNADYVRGVIARFGAEERAEMADDDGFISVDCEFCSRVFPIRLSDLWTALTRGRRSGAAIVLYLSRRGEGAAERAAASGVLGRDAFRDCRPSRGLRLREPLHRLAGRDPGCAANPMLARLESGQWELRGPNNARIAAICLGNPILLDPAAPPRRQLQPRRRRRRRASMTVQLFLPGRRPRPDHASASKRRAWSRSTARASIAARPSRSAPRRAGSGPAEETALTACLPSPA